MSEGSAPGIEACEDCGAFLVAPKTPHAKGTCVKCGREKFTGPGPDGIQVEAGDTFVIPEGFLKISFDPTKGNGQFTRAGIAWFAQHLFAQGAAESSDRINESLDAYIEAADAALEASDLLSDLDLDSEPGMDAAIERVGDDSQKPEFWAMRVGAFSVRAKHAISAGDSAVGSWASQQAGLCWCVFQFIEHMVDLMWRGYRTFGVDELEAAIRFWEDADKGQVEEFWQAGLSKHSFVLSQLFAAPTIVIEEKPYVGGKEVGNLGGSLADFLLQNARTEAVTLVEIKRPATPLLGEEYRSRIFAPSTELAGAVAQAQRQRDLLLKQFNSLTEGKADFWPYDPLAVIIIGDTSMIETEDQRRSFELFRRGLKDIQVVTFDEVFGQARALLELIRKQPTSV
jgi:Domain of unknown function (DUF4263)